MIQDYLEIINRREKVQNYYISTGELISLIINSNIIDVLLVVISVEEFKTHFAKKLFDIYLVPQGLSMLGDAKVIDYTASYNMKEIFGRIIKVFN